MSKGDDFLKAIQNRRNLKIREIMCGDSNTTQPTKEEQLRDNNPGLKELWDQYQTMLKLVTPSPGEDERDHADALAMIRNIVATDKATGVPPGIRIEARRPKNSGEVK